MEDQNGAKKGYGYGKRPMWQWVVIYLVVGVIVYGAIYYFWMMPKAGSGSSNNYYQSAPSTNPYGN